MTRKRQRSDPHDEPLPPEDGWVSWGDQEVWAVGETSGGAPYGLTREDFRFHEICLAAGWYREALDREEAEPPDQALLRLRGILKRAQAT
ncbi:MAG TPA: hypothetical protein VLT62_10985 [Candidatus Methylomirabilis sp.]|nr:hypothetical protein [Candidatus Methylomirabilis sp.]